jgi:hypothetical protein
MLLGVRFNSFEQPGDDREFAGDSEFIFFDLRDAAALFVKIAAQILPGIVVAAVKIDHRRQLAAEVCDIFRDGTEMRRLSGRDTQERQADRAIGDSLGMLAQAHHMLQLANVAMTQNFERAITGLVPAVIQTPPSRQAMIIEQHTGLLSGGWQTALLRYPREEQRHSQARFDITGKVKGNPSA